MMDGIGVNRLVVCPLLVAFGSLCGGMTAILARHGGPAGSLQVQPATQTAPWTRTPSASHILSTLPLSFEENRGAADARVKFVSRGTGYVLFLTANEVVMVFDASGSRSVIRMRPVDADVRVSVSGVEQLPGTTNYLVGSDPSRWHLHCPNYRAVRYSGLYPGIDLVYRGSQRTLEYDWDVSPRADPARIRFHVEGARKLWIDKNSGELVADAPPGQLRQRPPVAYQQVNGSRRHIAATYVLNGDDSFSFRIAPYDRSLRLVIDPVVVYTALIGGTSFPPASLTTDPGTPREVTVDPTGNVYVMGTTNATDFPATRSIPAAGGNIFVLKIDPTGSTLLFSTILGGPGGLAGAITADLSGVYITGQAGRDYPVTANAFQASSGGNGDAFVSKLDATGSTLLYSALLGGSWSDIGTGIAVDGLGNAYVSGNTGSSDFPRTPGALQTCGSTGGAFVTKVNAQGTALIYSACIAGGTASGIAVDSDGSAYVAGSTTAANFPTTPGAFQPNFSGGNCPTGPCSDAFVLKLNATGTALAYSTFLGGFGIDEAAAVAVDSSGNAYVAGRTSAEDFPTKAAIQSRFGGGSADAFIAKLNPAGSALVCSTYLGGTGDDRASAIAVDASGSAYVTGFTDSSNFPLVNPIQAALAGGSPTQCLVTAPCGDAFIAKLNPAGSGLVYSTYFGGGGNDFGSGIASDASGNAYVAGLWNSGTSEFPVLGPIQRSPGAGSFILKLREAGVLPLFTALSVTNAASFESGLAPGEIATVFGKGITNTPGILRATGFPLPRELDRISVTINGAQVPLFAIANVAGQEQINFQAPTNITSLATMVVLNNRMQSMPVGVSVFDVQPGIFTTDGITGAIQHASNFQAVTLANPAVKGEAVILYATGLGPVQPDPGVGNAANTNPLSLTQITPAVTVGGKSAEVLFSGLAPGFAALNQVNIRIPQDAPSGSIDVTIGVTVSGAGGFGTFSRTSKAVTLSIQ